MRILFISHDANRAGAQLILLQLMTWIKEKHPNTYFDLLLLKGGVLKPQFEAIANTFIYPSNSSNKSEIIQRYIKYKRRSLYKQLKRKCYTLIYSNTVMNGFVLEELAFLKVPVITHAHEMDYWIKKAGDINSAYVRKNTTHFITASNAVSESLERHGISTTKRTEIVYAFIDVKKFENTARKKSIKAKLNIPAESVIIGACGAESYRKGKDWFVPIATEVLQKKAGSPIHFVWIGGGELSDEIKFDLERCGHKNRIHFVNFQSEANIYFNEFDLFLMLSREDPFPIVNLEAGVGQIPIICFNESGGTSELLKNGGGVCVPYANLSQFSHVILEFLTNSDARMEAGQMLRNEVCNKFDIEIVAGRIFSIIKRVNVQSQSIEDFGYEKSIE
jgi:glycosyltransferase involved in cell wall biosynthesis